MIIYFLIKPEEAIRFINMRPKPLSLYLFTLSKALQQQFVAETTCGGLTVSLTIFP